MIYSKGNKTFLVNQLVFLKGNTTFLVNQLVFLKGNKTFLVNQLVFLKVNIFFPEDEFSLWINTIPIVLFGVHSNWKFKCLSETRSDNVYPYLPYLGLHNTQDFAQILYFVGEVRIINRNHVFHSFPDREITCPPCFLVYYCQHAKLNIS